MSTPGFATMYLILLIKEMMRTLGYEEPTIQQCNDWLDEDPENLNCMLGQLIAEYRGYLQ